MTGCVAGIDLGGTKIRTTVFDIDWQVIHTQRIATPHSSYDELLHSLSEQIAWIHSRTGSNHTPIGIGLPGVINHTTQRLKAANLAANDQTIQADLEALSTVSVTFINDCKAFALSEACLGAASMHQSVLGISIGTGLAGGLVTHQTLLSDFNGSSGEFGHTCLPADIVSALQLPVLSCGCGQQQCYETFLSGPGLIRLGDALQGTHQSVEQWSSDYKNNHPAAIELSRCWFEILASLTSSLALCYDPECIVIGGGMSHWPDFLQQASAAHTKAQRLSNRTPHFRLAQADDQSGARGAALAARQQQS